MTQTPVSWFSRSGSDAVTDTGSNAETGLADAEAATRLASSGPNALPHKGPKSLFMVFVGQFKSPLIFLLLVAAVVAFAIGERTDAAVIAVVVALNAIIGTVQEGRAERSLQALRKLSAHHCRVVRGGRELELLTRDVVVGDIVVVAAGDAVPADARVLEAAALQVSESSLTGESTSVTKQAEPVPASAVLADRQSMIFAGTHVAAGRGRAVVVATGTGTEIGHIAHLAATSVEPPTPLERRIARLGRIIIIVAVGLFFVVIGAGLLRGVELHDIVMIAVSQIVGLVPEGLPVAMTVALAVGVQRMAKRRAVVRRLSAVETLGCTTVICTDKTGTLTKNEMTVTTVVLADGRTVTVDGVGYAPTGALTLDGRAVKAGADAALDALLQAVVLCNDGTLTAPSEKDDAWRPLGDPTEVALVTLGQKAGLVPEALRVQQRRRAEIPFDADAKMMATEHRAKDGSGDVVNIKGAPEAVLALCRTFRQKDGSDAPFDDVARARITAAAAEMGARALRVLAVAVANNGTIDGDAGFAGLGEATLLGLVGQIDPPRDEVKDAVARCRAAGIRPVMITGDHKATAIAIGTLIGIVRDGDDAIDGVELEAIDDDTLARRLPAIAVFARVHPAQKLRIVTALQKLHPVVAMTGDGVNDAPALMRADVGVAMGITGTEVAKDAAKIILVDDNFATLVAAIEEGRVVYRNIKKATLLLLSTAFAEVAVLLAALIVGLPPPFAAVQILWNNLVTEGLITVNLIMEPAEGDEMTRHPIDPHEPLIDRVLRGRMFVMVPTIVVVTLGWLMGRTAVGVSAAQVQTETFTLLALCEWFNVLNCRSDVRSAFSLSLFRNPWLLGGLVLGNLLQVAVVFAPPLQSVFRTVPFGWWEFVMLGVVASTVLWVEELRKVVVRRRRRLAAVASAPATPAT